MADLPNAESLFGPAPDAGKAAGLPDGLWAHVKEVESNNNNKAVSKKGAVGASQVMPATARSPGFGLAPFDSKNPDAGAPYLKKMIDLSGGDVVKGLARYNAGPNGNLKNPETQGYVDKVMKGWQPPADSLFGDAPPPALSSLSKGVQPPASANKPSPEQQKQQQLQQAQKDSKEHPLLAQAGFFHEGETQPGDPLYAIMHPADRAVDLMAQDTKTLFSDIGKLVKKPSIKGAFHTVLDALSLPFSPVSSVTQGLLGDPTKDVAHKIGVPTKWDPTLDTVTQMAAGVGLTKSKTLQAAMDPVAKFLLGAQDTAHANMVAGQSARHVSDQLARAEGKNDAVMTKWRASVDQQLPANYATIKEDIFHAYDTGDTSKLAPDALAFKKNVLDPVAKKTALLRDRLKQYGVDVGPDQANYITRRPMDKPTRGLFGDFDAPMDVKTQPKTLATGAPELKERTTFAVESPSGDRVIGITDPATERVILYKNNQRIGSGVDNGKGGISVQGATWAKKTDATVKEIETHTESRYHKDPVAAVVQANVDMQKALINAQAIENIKTTPEFQSMARPPTATAPSNWRTVDMPGTRQFEGWKMHPQMAETFEDFKGTVHGDLVDRLGKLNRFVVGSLFFNPLPHIMNVLTHSVVEKGLVGNVVSLGKEAGRALNPNLTTTTVDAWKAVWNKDHNYMKYLNEGAGLMYPSVYTNDFFDTVLKKVGSDPAAGTLAKSFGYANPKAWLSAVYGTARKSLWFANDVIMMQAYLEKERAGHTVASAVADVEKHVPNYRIPNKVLGSRGLSLALRNPAVAAFGRYDYGRMASYGYMLTDLTRTDKGLNALQRAKALDQIAATAFISFFVYPHVMDKMAATVTGNPNATATRYGPATIPTLVHDAFVGKKDAGQIMGTALPSSPVFKAANELSTDKDSFTGKKIYGQGGTGFLQYIGKQIAPVGLVEQWNQGKKSTKQILLQQFGISSPTREQVEKTQKWLERSQKANARAEAKKDAQ